ncbi:MAG: NAD-dependent deacylase [Gemmatimonadota bacterium]
MIPAALAALLQQAKRIAVLTGAGVSAESGIPTFRDALSGLWSSFRVEDLATPEAFARNPGLVWRWYRARRHTIAEARPNPGHYALAAMQARVPHFALITQNVDGLHERAGSTDVIELHGSIARVKCSGCDQVVREYADTDDVPSCPDCAGLLRPDVVWFGELLPAAAMERAQRAACEADVFLSVGTSNIVEPAASLPRTAARSGATVIVVNPSREGQREGRNVHFVLGPAGEVLPEMVRGFVGG